MTPETKGRIVAAVAAPLFLLHAGTGHCRAAPAAAATEATVRLDRISIQATGRGSPVILIPGLSSPRDVWDGVVPALARNHRVLTVQVDGFGSGAPGANLTPGILDGVVADLDRYVAANHLQGAAVVGHSMGGLIGLMLAHAHPADVGKLMVVDALPYIGDIFLPGAQVAQVEPQARAMRDQIAATYGRPADPAVGARTAAGMALKPTSQAMVAKWIAAADPRVTAQAMYEDMTTDLRPVMPTIATPITLVYPYSDQLPQAKADAFYHGEYADAQHVTYAPVGDSAHFVMLDQPAAFAAALDTFLAS